MASVMIGRATCPECGFKSAHVKQGEKCLYRYCPDCTAQYYARTNKQRENLMAQSRIDATATDTEKAKPAPAVVATVPTTDTDTAGNGNNASPSAEAPAKRRRLF